MRDPDEHDDEYAPAGEIEPKFAVPRSGTITLRVRYCECDPQGVAHHSSFLPWLEEGRTQLLRDAGVSYAAMEASGVFLVVAKFELRYRGPAKYDDRLEIRTRVTGGGRARLDHAYEVVVLERVGGTTASGVPILEATSTLACVDRAGKPTAMPEWLMPR